MKELIKQRIEKNKNIFNEKELLQIENNYSILIKVYILGLLDGNNF